MSVNDLPRHRAAGPEDAPAVLELMRGFYADEHLVFDEIATPRAVHELLSTPSAGVLLLLEWQQVPVGYIVLTFGFSAEFHGRYALLDELYLAPSVRGRGWSRRCLQLATDCARERGIATLRLEVSHDNARARSIYLKAGFTDNRRDILTRWLDRP